MKVLVTGGAGYIGSVCVEELFAAGHEVVVWDNLSEGHQAALHPRAVFLRGDLLDRDLLIRAVGEHRPEAVIHFAGKALVPESMKDPSTYYRVNVNGGLNLLDAMVASGCRKIIFSSTCATYGLPERVPIDESTAQKPINPYGHSKLMFEQILGWYAQIHGIVPTCLRYFKAVGGGVWGAACDPGRDLHPRLHPCAGPGLRTHSRAAPGTARIFQRGHGQRLFREAGD